MDDIISRKKLLTQTAEWEAAALEQVGKLDPRNGPEEREEWVKWSYILKERSAFREDVETAPAAEKKTVKWIGDNAAEEMAYWHDVDLSYLPLDKPEMPKDAAFPKYCPYCGARMEDNDE